MTALIDSAPGIMRQGMISHTRPHLAVGGLVKCMLGVATSCEGLGQ